MGARGRRYDIRDMSFALSCGPHNATRPLGEGAVKGAVAGYFVAAAATAGGMRSISLGSKGFGMM